MPIKTLISLIFIFLLTFSVPVKASVYSSNTAHIATKQPLNMLHFPKKKMDSGTTILAIFLCILAGSMGIHRVVMGGSPFLILAYTFTFGGFFLLLPLMDFLRILSEPEHYENNNKFLAAFGAM